MKMRRGCSPVLLVLLLLSGLACASQNQQVKLPWPYEDRAAQQVFSQQMRHAFADCTTANNTPVAPCVDWITGPASAQNPKIPMYRRDPTSNVWKPATLYETDIGWPVMSPDGKKLELLAYGDTLVENPAYTTANRYSDIQSCAKQSVSGTCKSNKDCQTIFKEIGDKREACAYWLAKQDHQYPGSGMVLLAFDQQNNAVFFNAKLDPTSPYRFKLKDHLYNKAVRHNSMEHAFSTLGYKPFTGVYATDAFYLCPNATEACADTDKVLYFVTGTVFWHLHQEDPSKLKDVEKHFKATREGIGFYRFGTLKVKTVTSSGCRVPFAPPIPTVSCPSKIADDLHPKDPLYTASNTQVDRSKNPNVLWGWGSKFAQTIVMHDFVDPYHSGEIKSEHYIYFLGSMELSSTIDKTTNAAHYQPTNNIYMARLPAWEDALFGAQFEYYMGRSGGKSLWGSYDQATPLFNSLLPIFPSSFTKRHGRYYLAASCIAGMCVASSKDGYLWDKADYASYTDLKVDDPSSSIKLVYGHAWVPAGLYSHPSAIPYVFSAWKQRGGYGADFWFKGKPKVPLALERRFYTYNTKMYLYWPK